MKEFEKTAIGSDAEVVNEVTKDDEVDRPNTEGFSRRNFLGVSPTVLAAAGLAGLTAHAQETKDTRKAEKDTSASDP